MDWYRFYISVLQLIFSFSIVSVLLLPSDYIYSQACSRAAWAQIQRLPSPNKNLDDSIILRDTIYIGMGLLNFMLTGLTEAENVHSVLYNYIIGN